MPKSRPNVLTKSQCYALSRAFNRDQLQSQSRLIAIPEFRRGVGWIMVVAMLPELQSPRVKTTANRLSRIHI